MLAMPLCFRSVHLLFSACRSAARGRSLSPLFVNCLHSHNLTFERSSHSLLGIAGDEREGVPVLILQEAQASGVMPGTIE